MHTLYLAPGNKGRVRLAPGPKNNRQVQPPPRLVPGLGVGKINLQHTPRACL